MHFIVYLIYGRMKTLITILTPTPAHAALVGNERPVTSSTV